MKKFYSQRLFSYKNTRKISFLEIAKHLGVSQRTAKRYIKTDLENGFISKKSTQYKCSKYKVLLSGRNIYSLTESGLSQLKDRRESVLTPQRFYKKNSSKEEFAKSRLKETCSISEKERLLVFQKHNLINLAKTAPKWWFRDISVLEKTLKLLSTKIKKGYKVKNPWRWISSVLADKGRGFRYKRAKDTSLILTGRKTKRGRILETVSDRVRSDFSRLEGLKKRGLDTSFAEMEKLMRKGFAHLSQCIEVLTKVLKSRPIHNLNGFLNWLVSLKEPFEVFQKKRKTVLEKINWAKELFTKSASNCVFATAPEFRMRLKRKQELDQGKKLVHFSIAREEVNLERSFIQILQWTQSGWDFVRISVRSDLFEKTLLVKIAN